MTKTSPAPVRSARLLQDLRRLRLECALGTTALGALDISALAIDGRGRMVLCSCEAQDLPRWGLELGASRRIVVAGSAPDTARLHRLLQDAIERSRRGAMLIHSADSGTAGNAAIHAVIVPLATLSPAVHGAHEPMASVIASNLDRRSYVLAGQVTALFSLSPAEARLARALATGHTPTQFALEAKLSIATVRSQLRSVFAKTGTGRQVELVRLLASIPPLKS